jgi:tetratricopeptide (TPR) repeat protein
VFYRPFLIKLDPKLGFKWFSKVHNYIAPTKSLHKSVKTDQCTIINHGGGAKSHGLTIKEKMMKDAKYFKEEVKKNNDDFGRNWFYLGQSLFNAEEYKDALVAFEKRIEMDTPYEKQEKWICMLQKAIIYEILKKDEKDIINAYLDCFEFRENRVEPLVKLGFYFIEKKKYEEGYQILRRAIEIPLPMFEMSMINEDMYTFGALDAFALCAFMIGEYHQAGKAYEKILEEKKYPKDSHDRIYANYMVSKERAKTMEKMDYMMLEQKAS